MEDTGNGRQTPMSAPAGGSSNDCPVRGERLMHLATSPVFSAALLHHCGDSWSGVETAGVLSAPDRRRIWLYHQKSKEGKPFQVASLSWDFQKCVILAAFHFSKQVLFKSSWSICSLSPCTVSKGSVVPTL